MLDSKESEISYESLVKKIDYDSLEVSLYKNPIVDHHKLIEIINLWACDIGFLVKLKRSPKVNADGSQTLRLYCQSYKKSDVHSCPYAMTFKQDDKTGCWLLYQEYSEGSMRHSHNLEKRKFDSVKDYVREYSNKVRSVAELRSQLQHQFGINYTQNQISYFKAKVGDVAGEPHTSENDCQTLVKLLKKNAAIDGDFLDHEIDQQGNLQFLFYSTQKMKENYLKSSDLLFVNKRFTQNRFKRPLLMFLTVSAIGKSQLLGIALVDKEETSFFGRAVQCFLKHMDNQAPQTVIIERHLKLF